MTAQVVFDSSEVTISELLKAIQDAGFAAELLQKQEDAPQMEVPPPASGLQSSSPYKNTATRMHALLHD